LYFDATYQGKNPGSRDGYYPAPVLVLAAVLEGIA
jgi:hypothetical protein